MDEFILFRLFQSIFSIIDRTALRIGLPIYFTLRPWPGKEVPWLKFAKIQNSSGRILIADPYTWEGLTVDIGPGSYDIQIKLARLRTMRGIRISRLRVGPSWAKIGASVGEVSVDVATVVVCDARALETEKFKESADRPDFHRRWSKPWARFRWGNGTGEYMAFSSTGLGDGTYTVRELVRGDRRVGVEIEFIDPQNLNALEILG